MLAIDLNICNIVFKDSWHVELKRIEEAVNTLSSMYPFRKTGHNCYFTSGKVPLEKTISKQVLPQAPSPTMTSFLLISVMLKEKEISTMLYGEAKSCGFILQLGV
jgi:hypothetical protein